MEFLKVAFMAPMTNLGIGGMLVAVILWAVALYYGVRFGYGGRKPSGPLYLVSLLITAVMLTGLGLMLFSREFDNQNSAAFQFYGLLQLFTFGNVGGFILVMAFSVGFAFGVFIRVLESLTAKTMR